jgi:hypothetical protein
LKVRSEEVIGQIHACPKCESMVQIVPPAGWSAIAAGMSQEFTPVTKTAEAAPAEPVALAPAEVMLMDFGVPSAEGADTVGMVAKATAPSSTLWLVWGVSGAAVLLVGGLVAALWPGGEPANVAPVKPAAQPPAVVGDDEQTLASVAEEPDSTAEPADPDSPPSEPALRETPSQDDAAVAAAPAVTEQVADALPSLPPPTDASDATGAEEEVAKEATRSPVMKLDPLDFDASALTLAPSTVPAVGSIPPGAEGVADAPQSESVPPAEEAPVAPKVDHSLTVRLGPMLDGAPRPHGVAEQLSLRVNSFEVAEMPLETFIGAVSDLANLAITVDPVALELAGVSARQPVSAKAGDATVEKLLTDSLAKVRLSLVDNGGHIELELAGGEKRRAIDYDVADLVGNGGKQLASLIQRFVAPESWQSGGGAIEVRGAKLHVDHTQNIRHQVLIFCERLRLARGMSLRSRYPAALLSVEPAFQQVAAKLNQKTTFTFLPWTRLADVVRHCEDASGLTMVVDWAALADTELSPNSPIACSANNRAWQDVLDKTLEPFGLAWWPVSKDTIQITTADAIEDVQRIEFYSIPMPMREQFATSESLVASLQDELMKQGGAQVKQPAMAIDEASGRLIVLGSPVVHRLLGARLAE